ncbi:carboxymuconolactone decarboxylase family protein [Bradyrhizobium liaoningense]|uniref:carboxymuconolactone decarboxylase family protein n=1 Tax=Bradyrhizobium liaoningense TaxID=43992 RepID=UPI001BA95BD5|nr:carboxymuconolactone decarboxylase family protein [Bradyrhizobium liaoningense]MBR0840379.1 carboxymuconolactone decarboxylase family protein [Bradyrhizobium liaoningense]
MPSNRYEQGAKIRREVLGEKYAVAAEKKTDDFIRPFREISAEFIWGSIWSRPGLDRRTRTLINIAVLTALGRPEELKIYFNAIDNVGVTKSEVQEALLHMMVYCGAPAAFDAFRIAQEQLKDHE